MASATILGAILTAWSTHYGFKFWKKEKISKLTGTFVLTKRINKKEFRSVLETAISKQELLNAEVRLRGKRAYL